MLGRPDGSRKQSYSVFGSVPGRMQMKTVFEKLVSGTEFQNSFQ